GLVSEAIPSVVSIFSQVPIYSAGGALPQSTGVEAGCSQDAKKTVQLQRRVRRDFVIGFS
ncbi:MAG TPA: hypothetical protein VJ861_05015, partial [Treponemataceae bacterium]|nr:hypothetical protein [Treponemataceae bacterium]